MAEERERETVASVGGWADATFGPGDVKSRCLRLLREVLELCEAAGATYEETSEESLWSKLLANAVDPRPGDPDKVPGELADCAIVLKTIAHTAGVDLDHEEVKKMAVNRSRKWDRTGGGCGQHVE